MCKSVIYINGPLSGLSVGFIITLRGNQDKESKKIEKKNSWGFDMKMRLINCEIDKNSYQSDEKVAKIQYS